MPIKRIITDIAPEDVAFYRDIMNLDGGTTTVLPQSDGTVTIVADFSKFQAVLESPTGQGPEAAWFRIAQGEIGTREVRGNGSNPQIESYHATTSLGLRSDSVPWCSSFVNYCVVKSGHTGTNSAVARSWLTWGREASAFVPGCIIVLKWGSPPKGHVGFFAGRDGDDVVVLGGNQSDAVNVASFKVGQVIAKRML